MFTAGTLTDTGFTRRKMTINKAKKGTDALGQR